MKFEFDQSKSESNKVKHGVDFIEIQALWANTKVEVPAKSEGEFRYAILGLLNGENYTVIVTYRGPVTRIISARRSTEKEILFYEQKTKT